MQKLKVLIPLLLIVFASFPPIVFAESWVEKQTGKVLTSTAKFVFEPALDGMVVALGAMMSTPSFRSGDLQFVHVVMQDMQILAFSLLTLTVAFRIWRTTTGKVMGGQAEPIPDILFRAVVSGILIFILPEILNKLIELNNVFISYVQTRGVNLTEGLKAVAYPATGKFILVVAICIFIIALIGLTVSNAIRIAELCLLYVFAPIMAVSHAGKGEAFQIWITQAVAVSLTQSVQFYLVGLALNLTGNIDMMQWWSWIAPIGAIVISIRGPQLLKQYLYTSGVGGFSTGTGQSIVSSAVYSKMMKIGVGGKGA